MSTTSMKILGKHLRECATCSSTLMPGELCEKGKGILLGVSGAQPIVATMAEPTGLLRRALAFIKANEFGGSTMESGKRISTCLDCGAAAGEMHSEQCEVDAILTEGGQR